jgi:hypothetical protein
MKKHQSGLPNCGYGLSLGHDAKAEKAVLSVVPRQVYLCPAWHVSAE